MILSDFRKNIPNGYMHCYRIRFINDDNEYDETEFTARDLEELNDLFVDFCEENEFSNVKVENVEKADTTYGVTFDITIEDSESDNVIEYIKEIMLEGMPGVLSVGNVQVIDSDTWEVC